MGTKTKAVRNRKAKVPQLRIRAGAELLQKIERHAAEFGMTTNSYIISVVARDMRHGHTADVHALQDAIGNLATLIKVIGGFEKWDESKESRAALAAGLNRILDGGRIDTPQLARLQATLTTLLADDTRAAVGKMASAHHG